MFRLNEELGKKTSRLASLGSSRTATSGATRGRGPSSGRGRGRLSLDSVHGLVADHIEVPREYEVAVEAALGERLQYVVVKSQEEGIGPSTT